MLGNSVLTVRMGGIYALQQLAEEHSGQYHVQVMRLFCTFVRLPTKDNEVKFHPENDDEPDEQTQTLRADVQDVVRAIGFRSRAGISLEQSEKDFSPHFPYG